VKIFKEMDTFTKTDSFQIQKTISPENKGYFREVSGPCSDPGFDGVYGKIQIFAEKEKEETKQLGLF
jgi:hypothetical protein